MSGEGRKEGGCVKPGSQLAPTNGCCAANNNDGSQAGVRAAGMIALECPLWS